jgi:hypothetical protein
MVWKPDTPLYKLIDSLLLNHTAYEDTDNYNNHNQNNEYPISCIESKHGPPDLFGIYCSVSLGKVSTPACSPTIL